jgi:hypothetical protein
MDLPNYIFHFSYMYRPIVVSLSSQQLPWARNTSYPSLDYAAPHPPKQILSSLSSCVRFADITSVAAMTAVFWGYGAVYSDRFILTFRIYIGPPSSRYREFGKLDLQASCLRERETLG